MKTPLAISALLLFSCGTSDPIHVTEFPGLPAGGGSARQVTYLAGRMDPQMVTQLEASAPNLRVVSGLNRESALALAGEADGADVGLVTQEFMAAADQLTWIQIPSAGVERYLARPEIQSAPDSVVLTNARGVHGPVIAEHVFGMLLSQTRGLAAAQQAQSEGSWDRGVGTGNTSLAGNTLLVVGMGGIGTEVAKRAKGFDMRVLATVRSQRAAPDFVDRLESAEHLDELLPEADVVVVCLPLTAETEGLFDAERVGRMKRGARLVNIARGQIVDTEALLAALESGQLAGACLDVTYPEPLPAEHPLWSRADVLITPHVAGRADLTGERREALVLENLQRFAAGEPLLNAVDREAGY